MIQKTDALVISRVKYGENSLVVHALTRDFGFRSYFVKNISNAKTSKFKSVFFFPFQEIEVVAYHTQANLFSIKEISLKSHYKTLYTDLKKQSICIFLSEILNHTLQKEQTESVFYQKIKNLLLWLDENDNIANFHLYFLIQIIHFLGFLPENGNSEPYFDLSEGKFLTLPYSSYFIEDKVLEYFKILVLNDLEKTINMQLSHQQRNMLLDVLLQYLTLHHQNFKKPKSIVVLQELFH